MRVCTQVREGIMAIRSIFRITILALRSVSMRRSHTQAEVSPATVVPGLVLPIFITRLFVVIIRTHLLYLFTIIPEGVL